jgi:hypothetical protein
MMASAMLSHHRITARVLIFGVLHATSVLRLRVPGL